MANKHHISILRRQLLGETTEAEVYRQLAQLATSEHNRQVLLGIAQDEARHAEMIRGILGETVRPNRWKIACSVWNARIFGLTFALKLMERGEQKAEAAYQEAAATYPQLEEIARDEAAHERALIDLLNDERLNNMGSIVLGLNDALVELTGALAGFTFALGDSTRIAKTGLITGLAAAMSMAASAFLSARAGAQAEGEADSGAGKAALYTGIAYVVTVFLLIAPYLLLTNVTFALIAMLLTAMGIIAFFNFYLSVARETSFKRGFFEMAGISTVVALISYIIGYFLR